MADVFLSYARPDGSIAANYAAAIAQGGLSCFFDLNISVGESWDERIEREIEAAKAVVVLWSPRSRQSKWVRREARDGQFRGILCPALIDSCVIPLEFTDVQAANLIGWNGETTDAEWQRLLARISSLCRSKSGAVQREVSALTLTSEQERALLIILIAAALSDGDLTEEESDELMVIAQRSRVLRTKSRAELGEMYAAATRQPKTHARAVQDAAELLSDDLGPAVFAHAASIVMAEPLISISEMEFLTRLAAWLRIDNTEARSIIEVLQIRNNI
jgi:TIR domain